MTLNILLSLIGIALTTSWTPGPNNSMLASSGATYGIRASLPHVFGVMLGFPVMIFLVGLGLGELFQTHPIMEQVLRYVGAAMMLWIAWKIANAAAPKDAKTGGKPLTFLQAAAFQWVNPKAVYMAITAQTYYAPEGSGWWGAALVAAIFAMVNLPSVSLWAWGGMQVRRWLATPSRLRAFNWTMALALVVTLIPIWT